MREVKGVEEGVQAGVVGRVGPGEMEGGEAVAHKKLAGIASLHSDSGPAHKHRSLTAILQTMCLYAETKTAVLSSQYCWMSALC